MEMKGRSVVVTGGAGALGAAVVGRLIEAGALCHVPALDDGEAARFPHAANDRVRLIVAGDLAEWGVVERFFSGIDGLWASIHLAGGFDMGGIADAPPDIFQRQVSMNAATCYLCCRAAIPAMRRTGDGGRIVNVSARPGVEPRTGAGMAAYAAAKAAVAALTQALAEEVAEERIRVNAVAPSILDTPANRAAMPEADHDAWPKTAEVAETIVFLASPDNAVARGAVVPVYGGV